MASPDSTEPINTPWWLGFYELLMDVKHHLATGDVASAAGGSDVTENIWHKTLDHTTIRWSGGLNIND